MIGWSLCVGAVVGLVGIGVAALVAPGMSSAQYGIVVPDRRALAFLRAMGVRDLVIGILLGLLLWAERPTALACGAAASALIALVDFAVVWSDGGGALSSGPVPPGPMPSRRVSLLLHGGGCAGLVLTALLILAGI
jgi:Domain of unknown function (DUF4267)